MIHMYIYTDVNHEANCNNREESAKLKNRLWFTDKPIFTSIDPHEMIGMEGEPFMISVSAIGNPNEIKYTWTRDGLSLASNSRRISVRGSMLNITKLERHDAGTYICEATNEEGTTFYQLNLTVQCKYEQFVDKKKEVSRPRKVPTVCKKNPSSRKHFPR